MTDKHFTISLEDEGRGLKFSVCYGVQNLVCSSWGTFESFVGSSTWFRMEASRWSFPICVLRSRCLSPAFEVNGRRSETTRKSNVSKDIHFLFRNRAGEEIIDSNQTTGSFSLASLRLAPRPYSKKRPFFFLDFRTRSVLVGFSSAVISPSALTDKKRKPRNLSQSKRQR